MAESQISEKVRSFGAKKIELARINALAREDQKWTWEVTQARIKALEAEIASLKKGK